MIWPKQTMILSKQLLPLAAAALVAGLTGCQTHKATLALANGYEQVSHPHHTLIDEPEPPRISFQYRAANGDVTEIWPSLYGVNAVIKGDLAFFVGDRGVAAERVTRPRLFAVRPGELPLDLTDEILWRWSKANHQDVGQAMVKYTAIAPIEKSGGLQLNLEFISEDRMLGQDNNWPDNSALWLDWNQVTEITRAVKTKGATQKDPRWHTSFIGEKF